MRGTSRGSPNLFVLQNGPGALTSFGRLDSTARAALAGLAVAQQVFCRNCEQMLRRRRLKTQGRFCPHCRHLAPYFAALCMNGGFCRPVAARFSVVRRTDTALARTPRNQKWCGRALPCLSNPAYRFCHTCRDSLT